MGYIVSMYFTWDPVKAESNFKKHGVSFEEAAGALMARTGLEAEDTNHDEMRIVRIAFSPKLNLLVVVYVERFEDEIRIISARKATTREARDYEKGI